MAGETFTLVGSITVPTGGAATVAFTNIAQGGSDLYLEVSSLGGGSLPLVQPNGDAANSISRFIQGVGVNVSTATATSIAFTTGAGGAGTAPAVNVVYISNYTSITAKLISVDSGRNGSAGFTSGYYNSTTPLTSLTLAASSGSFLEGSVFSLYQIRRNAGDATIA